MKTILSLVALMLVTVLGCDKAQTNSQVSTSASTPVAVPIDQPMVQMVTYENTVNYTVYLNLGKNAEGYTEKHGTFPGQTNRIPVTIPAGQNEVEVPVENEQGKVLMTLLVGRSAIR